MIVPMGYDQNGRIQNDLSRISASNIKTSLSCVNDVDTLVCKFKQIAFLRYTQYNYVFLSKCCVHEDNALSTVLK